MTMSIFAKIKEAKVFVTGQYFEPGNYIVKVKSVKLQPASDKPGVVYFIIESEVLWSDNPNIAVGSERSQVINMSNIMALPNVKNFMGAASGFDPTREDLNDQVEATWSQMLGRQVDFPMICELAAGSLNPLEGTILNLLCTNIKTKETGNDFTKHMWTPYVEPPAV